MSLKRTNYLCGHLSCDNKKCPVRLARELTRAVCDVLERGHRDKMRKERLLSHVTEAGEDIPDLPDLPDLATLDLPLIEDSDTKISFSGGKLHDIVEIDTTKRFKGMRENVSSRQSDGLTLEASINSAKSNRGSAASRTVTTEESRKKNVPRSTYGPGSDYLKYVDVLGRQAKSKINSSNSRPKIEFSKTGSARLTKVYGEYADPRSHTARMDFLRYQNKINSMKPDEACKNQVEEPIIIESKRRSNSARPNSQRESNVKPSAPPLNKKCLKPKSIIPDRVDDMEVIFQHNSFRMTQPKFQVIDMLAEPFASGEVESTTDTANLLNTFPSSWDAFNSEDSDTPVIEEPCRIETRLHQNVPQWPTETCVIPKKDEGLRTMPGNSLRTSDPEDTCVSRNLKKEIASHRPSKMPASCSARTPLPSIQEDSTSVGRYASDISTRNECKTQALTTPQTAAKPAGVLTPKPRSADASSTRQVSSRSPSRASPSETKPSTEELRSRKTSVTSRTSTGSKSRTSSAGSTTSGRAADSSAKCRKSRSALEKPNATAASTAEVSKSRIPIPTGKVVADTTATDKTSRMPTTSTKQVVGKNQTPSAVARTDGNSKQLNGRQSSRASTKTETPAVSTTKVEKSRPSSAASNSSTHHKIINGRRPSTASSTKSKTSTVSDTKEVMSKPSTATSTSTTNRKILNDRRPSMASTKSKTSIAFNKSRPSSAASNSSTDHKVLNSRQSSMASTKSKTPTISTTKLVNSRPSSAASNSSSLKGRHPSGASTKSKPDTESAKQVAQTKASSATRPSRIPVPVDTGSRPIRPRHLSNVSAKVDCRRPLTAVVNKLSPNVKLVDEKCRPQTSGSEGQSETTAKSRLARPASELKREPIQIQLGTKTQCVEGEHVKVVNKPVKLASNQSSDENNVLPIVQKRSSLQRSFQTKTACKGHMVDRSGGKDGVLENQTSKIPLPLNPVSRERLTLRDKKINSRSKVEEPSDSSKTVRKSNIPSISHIFDEMLEEKSMSSSEKAVLLKMNKALLQAGKLKPMRQVRTGTSPKGSKGNLVKANTELEDKVKGILPARKLSKANVRNMISLFDPCNASLTSGTTGIAAQKDELLENDYASLLGLDDSNSLIDSRQLKNSLTASMVEVVRDGNLQVPKFDGREELSSERQENSTLSNANHDSIDAS